MVDWLFEVQDVVEANAPRLDVACMDGTDLRSLVRGIEAILRPLAALKAQAVGEIDRKDAWDDGTCKSAEAWVAKETGASWGEAIREVELGQRLAKLPDTAQALVTGRISQTQAVEVARGAAADPHAEAALLQKAQWSTVKDLKTEANRVIARATDHAQTEQDRVHRTRFVRFGVKHDGAWTMEARLTKVAGAKVQAVLERYAKVEFEAGRSSGTWASHEAYVADGLVTMCDDFSAGSPRRGGTVDGDEGGASCDTPRAGSRRSYRPTSGPLALVEVRVDHAALVRGSVGEGEVCEIEGLGPIPVAEAERLLSDAILRVLLVKGGQVERISTNTRTIPGQIRAVLEHRDRTCVVPGCDFSWNLEIDHRVPFSQGGATDEENLARLCHAHHRDKTAGRAILERWEDDAGVPHWAWHPTTRPNEPRPPTFEELWPDTGTG